MSVLNIKLDTIDKVKKFVRIVSEFEGDFYIVSGKYVIDAKSILGIFSIDLSKPVTLQIEKAEDISHIESKLSEFIV